MDGNGRWAKSRGLIRTDGHAKGANVIESLCEFCIENGVKTLTLYAFSTENWSRPKVEVEFLMRLLERFLREKVELFVKNDIKFHTIGELGRFSEQIQSVARALKERTKSCQKLNLVLALNYGGRDEIVRAARRVVEAGVELSEASVAAALDTAEFGDVDLLVRTGGDVRVSNFLLWQISYAQMAFTRTLFPDFTKEELGRIASEFFTAHRRFGGL